MLSYLGCFWFLCDFDDSTPLSYSFHAELVVFRPLICSEIIMLLLGCCYQSFTFIAFVWGKSSEIPMPRNFSTGCSLTFRTLLIILSFISLSLHLSSNGLDWPSAHGPSLYIFPHHYRPVFGQIRSPEGRKQRQGRVSSYRLHSPSFFSGIL